MGFENEYKEQLIISKKPVGFKKAENLGFKDTSV